MCFIQAKNYRLRADIDVEDSTVYARHIVKKGETLGGIAIQYYGKGNVMKYKNILKNPDVIHPNQELVIPHLQKRGLVINF